jgi:hypothetical protein
MDHGWETSKAIKVLQEMNTKLHLNPNKGVDKLKKEQNQALKDNVDDLMARFQTKSRHWTAHSNQENGSRTYRIKH